MSTIQTCLWFDNNGEDAVKFYKKLFKDVKVGETMRWGKNQPGPEGQVLTMEFTLFGQPFLILNGGPQFKFNEAVSIMINCKTQKEVDKYWNALTSDGGEESMCGWCKDKFGLWWQIVPKGMTKMFTDKNKEKSGRAMQAMMKMRKLDINVIKKAFDGK
ncbi:MAG TPA: VOC family protein [Cyclobacteriaceae bacterium]|nr:VOC family protein [Cyclobacteriaceae bacterium]